MRLPLPSVTLIQDLGSVMMLDGEQHRRRLATVTAALWRARTTSGGVGQYSPPAYLSTSRRTSGVFISPGTTQLRRTPLAA